MAALTPAAQAITLACSENALDNVLQNAGVYRQDGTTTTTNSPTPQRDRPHAQGSGPPLPLRKEQS
jgi:hypothetical protein